MNVGTPALEEKKKSELVSSDLENRQCMSDAHDAVGEIK